MRKLIKTLVPKWLLQMRATVKDRYILKESYLYDYKRFLAHSTSFGESTSTKLICRIIIKYHVIEKGLTMPESRLGFGRDALLQLINDCQIYLMKYNPDDEQVAHAISVIFEYYNLHKQSNYTLDAELIREINKLEDSRKVLYSSKQIETTRDNYFSLLNESFAQFATSRKSIRNFSQENIDLSTIYKALELASTAPSACNRQAWRTYVFSDKEQIKEILEVQGGNRGFGQLTNKLIAIVSETSLFISSHERNQPFIDGGIYAMNLLYSLHYYKIGACILNCSHSLEKDKLMRVKCNVKDSEVFIAFIACGHPSNNFKIALSKRYPVKATNTFIGEDI